MTFLLIASILIFSVFSEEDKLSFDSFIARYKRDYGDQEYAVRRAIYQNNLKTIDYLNKKEGSVIYGVNKFADLSRDEFRSMYLMKKGRFIEKNPNGIPPKEFLFTQEVPPGTFDWRSRNAVTPTKNQGACGSCWAFSATEAIESQWFLSGKPLPQLAPQQIVDCDQGRGDQGCNGGDTTTAYEYVIAAGGMETESSYPYTGENDQCTFQKNLTVATIKNWTYITTTLDEVEMATKLYHLGPLSICVDASSWQFYIGGIVEHFCDSAPADLDHCVMITGYGYRTDWLDRNVSIWNIRNSWGTDWGYDGYIYVERGLNLCGVADEVTIPLV